MWPTFGGQLLLKASTAANWVASVAAVARKVGTIVMSRSGLDEPLLTVTGLR